MQQLQGNCFTVHKLFTRRYKSEKRIVFQTRSFVWKGMVITMKVNQRIALTKRLLQEALLRLLKIKSIDKINVTELCNESGINRATFYRHYNIPRDVLMDLQMQFIDDIQSAFDLSASTRPLSEYLEQLCMHLYNNSDLIKVFIHNNSEDDVVHLFNDIFRKYLEQNANMNSKHNLDSIDLKLISIYTKFSKESCTEWQHIKKTPRLHLQSREACW